MQRIKRRISIVISNKKGFQSLYIILQKINLIFFHWNERMHMIHPGKEDKESTYYVIRPRSNSEGLLSSYFYVLENIIWALERNYIPYVDYFGEKCQYHVERKINNTLNAWEYFFEQPSKIKHVQLKNKKNVLFSGWYIRDKYQIRTAVQKEYQKAIFGDVSRLVPIQPYINEMVKEIWDKKFNGKRTVGVFVRGTDYVRLKPKAHYVQPTIEQVIEKVNEFIEKYEIEQIYVVTEDYDYYTELEKQFGDMVFSNDNKFVRNYDSKDFISSSFLDDPYERGLAYLLRILLLAKCEYIVSSKANGSLFADLIRQEKSKEEYWFDLGRY